MSMRMLERTPEEYLKAPYARILIPDEEGGFIAEILEFPGCISQGDTAEEALKNLEAAANGWIEATLAQGQEVPPPSSNEGFSGKLVLRLPRSLHRQAVRQASRDGASLNQFLVTAVAARVGADDLYNRIVQRFAATAIISITYNATTLNLMIPTRAVTGTQTVTLPAAVLTAPLSFLTAPSSSTVEVKNA